MDTYHINKHVWTSWSMCWIAWASHAPQHCQEVIEPGNIQNIMHDSTWGKAFGQNAKGCILFGFKPAGLYKPLKMWFMWKQNCIALFILCSRVSLAVHTNPGWIQACAMWQSNMQEKSCWARHEHFPAFPGWVRIGHWSHCGSHYIFKSILNGSGAKPAPHTQHTHAPTCAHLLSGCMRRKTHSQGFLRSTSPNMVFHQHHEKWNPIYSTFCPHTNWLIHLWHQNYTQLKAHEEKKANISWQYRLVC